MTERMMGVAVGRVSDRDDKEGMGRVQVDFPWLGGEPKSTWASVAAPMAGNNRGAFLFPEVGDEVLVAFEHGKFEHAYVIGFLWNGEDEPPAKDARERVIRSKNGHAIRFIDSTPTSGDMGALIIEDAHGNRVTFSNGKISIKAVALIELDAPMVVIKGDGYRRTVVPSNNMV